MGWGVRNEWRFPETQGQVAKRHRREDLVALRLGVLAVPLTCQDRREAVS